jgi:nucleoside-diphosphate-sugar epimerase
MAREALKKIVVFGGNGFVGSEILRRLSSAPLVQAISVSRRGVAPSHCSDFANQVEWQAGDCLDASTYAAALEGAAAVVVSVGSPPLPGDVAEARRANGATNVTVIEAAAQAKVGRAVIVGATMPPWLDRVAEGYVLGKQDAFEALGAFALHDAATVVKPSAVYGTRHTASGYSIPLAPVMAPVSYALRLGRPVTGFLAGLAPSLLGGLLEPPVPVHAVAQTVVDACLEDEYGEGFVALGVEEILKRC